ncbi:putative tRNA/rRNA methyltransferase YsgA [Chlamydiales bacterium STE3]|nr:putative tRNA/rRNA methyltransferase YsgA [Chlamydiales bacterium STE3]
MRTITSLSNPYIKHLTKLRQNAFYRKQEKRAVIEGKHLVYEHSYLHALLVTDKALIPASTNAKGIYLIDEAIMRKISGTEHPEGIIAEVNLPDESPLIHCQSLLALDGVSDPGNLGTLFRTACAFGWPGIFLLPNCCDPFNDKALRAAKGATFKIPFRQGSFNELKEIAEISKLKPLCADLSGSPPETFSSENILLVIGNESKGLSHEVKAYCKAITLPMQDMESLNASVAGGILLYLFRKSLL